MEADHGLGEEGGNRNGLKDSDLPILMATRPIAKQSEHDDVVRASSRTYSKLQAEGYQVAINPDGEKNRSVGPPGNPRYPDVIVWKPKEPGSSSGTAKIIEEIETSDSVNEEEAKQWEDYAGLGVETFSLIVPKEKCAEAAEIVRKKAIKVTDIWYYETKGAGYSFSKCGT